LIAIGVEPECKFVARTLSRQGPKGEPDALITAESEIVTPHHEMTVLTRITSKDSQRNENSQVHAYKP
jgi:hypothetical protein